MATRAEIRQRVGEDLGIVPTGQALEAQDDARVDAAYGEAYSRIKEEGYAGWAENGDIPSKVVPYLCLFIEESLLISFSVPAERAALIKSAAGEGGDLALQKIAGLVSQEYTSLDDAAGF